MAFDFLPTDKFLASSNLKDNILNVAQMVQFFCDGEENIVGKGENAGNQHFLLFPQCFLKVSIFKVIKSRSLRERVNVFLTLL